MNFRPSPRRAWLSLFWGGLFLVAINLAANYWLPSRMTYWRDPAFYQRQTGLIERIQSKCVDSESQAAGRPLVVAMLGSSRVLCGLDAAQLEATLQTRFDRPAVAVNLGTPGSSAAHSLLNLGRLIRNGPHPDVVLIEAFPIFLRAGAQPAELVRTIEKPTQADVEWMARYGIPLPARLAEQPPDSPLAIWNYRAELFRTLPLPLRDGMLHRETDRYGATLMPDLTLDSPLRPKMFAHAKMEYYAVHRNYRSGGPGWQAVAAVLQACQEHNVSAAVVIMPEGPEMRSWYRPGAREEFLKKLNELAKQHHSPVMNGWEWQSEVEFGDSHHLRASGAKAFSERLAKELAAEPILIAAVSRPRKPVRSDY